MGIKYEKRQDSQNESAYVCSDISWILLTFLLFLSSSVATMIRTLGLVGFTKIIGILKYLFLKSVSLFRVPYKGLFCSLRKVMKAKDCYCSRCDWDVLFLVFTENVFNVPYAIFHPPFGISINV